MRRINILLIVLLIIVGAAFITGKIYTGFIVSDNIPSISCPNERIEVSVNADEKAILEGVTASDPEDGDLTSKVMIASISKLISADRAKVTYIVFDSDHNAAQATREIRYTDYTRPHFELKSPMIFTVGQSVTFDGKLSCTDVLDGDMTDSIRVSALDVSTSAAGNYTATVFVTNSMGDTAKVPIQIRMVEDATEERYVKLTKYIAYVKEGSVFNAEEYLVAGETGVEWSGEVDTSTKGSYFVTYTKNDGAAVITSILTVVVE